MGGKVKGTSWSVILRGGRHGSHFIFIITVKIKIK
jgi:hypothetical protein